MKLTLGHIADWIHAEGLGVSWGKIIHHTQERVLGVKQPTHGGAVARARGGGNLAVQVNLGPVQLLNQVALIDGRATVGCLYLGVSHRFLHGGALKDFL